MTRTVRVRLEVEAAGARREVSAFGGELRQLQTAAGAAGKHVDAAGVGLRTLGSESAKASQHVGGLTGVVQKLGLGGGIGAALGGLGAIEVVRKVVGGASDLNETINKSQQVFKGSASSILQWSSTSATSMGLSQRAALDGASSFQNLFSQIGLTGDASVKMSTNLVKLSSDFASFHNAAPEDVMDALLSATRGEYDALQRFVPTVNAAAIQTRALADSGKASADALTDAEKATALYEIVTEGAGAATGDFARTSNSAANEQRIFLAELENSAASLGNAVLPAYQGLLGVVNDVGPGTIIAAAGVAVLSNRIAESSGGIKVFDDLRAATSLYSESVASGTPRITAALESTKAATVGLRSAASGVVGLFGGPWGLALTAATLGVGLLAGKMEESRQKTDQAIASYVRFGDAVQNASTQEQVRDLIKHDEAVQDLIRDTDRYGLSSNTVVRALAGEKVATDQVNTALSQRREELVRTIEAHTVQGGKSGAVMDEQAIKAASEVKVIDKLAGSFGEATRKQTEAAEAAGTYTAATFNSKQAAAEHAAVVKSLSDAVGDLGPHYASLGGVIGLITDQTKSGKEAFTVFDTALKGVADSAIPAREALQQYMVIGDQVAASHLNSSQKASAYGSILQGLTHQALDSEPAYDALTATFSNIAGAELSASDKAGLLRQAWEQMNHAGADVMDSTEAFNESLLTLQDRLDGGSRSLDINSVAGIHNRDAVEDLVKKNNDLYFANIASGMSAEDAARQHDENAKKIEKAGQKAGLTKEEVAFLNGVYGDVPKVVNTDVRTTGAEGVLNQLRDMKIAQMALAQGIDISEARKQFRNSTGASGGFGGLAAGGPVVGPGGPTDDLIPASGPGGIRYRLSDGEHVITAAEVKRAGGHSAILEWRKWLLGGRPPMVDQPGDGSQGIAFAGGGAVNWPFNVNVSKTKIPVPPAPPAAVAAMNFLRAQNGKPYVWAAAGPGGYDCSGIVSAVWNILHNRSPYNHTFSTMNQAGYFPKPGFGVPLTAGWANPGEMGGGSVGHTAGVLTAGMTAVPFESGGGWGGVHVGQGATPVRSFAHIGHFADGGQVAAPNVNLTFNLASGGGVDPMQFSRGMIAAVKQYVSSAGGGNVQVAFGRRGS